MTDRRIPADAAARLRIVTELDRNLLVEAGAGSGKTHEMAARMAAGIASGAYVVDRMAAITFTRKAAAELRGRVQIALERELKSSAGDAARVARIDTALTNLERLFAGTIHAFCARLLRERPVEAGVAPGFSELDEPEEALLRRQSWRDFRAQLQSAGDPDLLALREVDINASDLDKAFETVCLYEDVDFPAPETPAPDATPVWPMLEQFWSGVERRMPALDPQATCKVLERARKFAREWRFAQLLPRTPARLAALLAPWASQPKVVKRSWRTSADAGEVERRCQEFRDAVVLPYLTAWRRFVYPRCVQLIVRAREAAATERRRRNALSFNDLLLLTATMLRTNPQVRRALQAKYRWLFVDEFQDTDPIQAEIMFWLAAEDSPADWRSATLRPGALFVVGDPKQSIYRFRRADIDIYNDVRARLAGPDNRGLVSLTTNFRSVPSLCEWANQIFATRFPAEPTSHAPRFAPLEPHRLADTRAAAIAVLDVPAGLRSAEAVAEEAQQIARYIHAEVASGRRTFGDFMILTRKKKHLRVYADALEARQVPIEVAGAGAFGESTEVRHLALLLATLADPQDGVALVGVLRGALFGLSDADLFAYRQSGGWIGVFSQEPAANTRDPRVARVQEALDTLARWHRWVRRLPIGAALELVLEESGYLALAATSPGGVEAGDLLHAVDRVRALVERGFTLAEAAEALSTWCGLDGEDPDDSPEVDSLPLEPGRGDVVRLMNLHKAKGLEASVVFLADPAGGFKPIADVRVLRSASGDGIARGYFPIDKPLGAFASTRLAEPPDWDALEEDERQYLDAETDRLLYVAATRARDLLVVSRCAGNVRQPAWDVFAPFLRGAPALPIPDDVPIAVAATVDLASRAAARDLAAAAAAHANARQATWAVTSVTAEAKNLPRVTPGTVEDEARPDDPTVVVVTETPSRRADAGVAWGSLVHGLLEHAMRHKSATRDDLRRLALWLTVEEPSLRPLIDRAIATVEAVARADFWSAARASSECHEEAPFAIRDSGADGRPLVVNGVVDLAFRDGDAWRIVDYKTDADAATADLASRHRAQLQAYERAWAAVSDTRVTATVKTTGTL